MIRNVTDPHTHIHEQEISIKEDVLRFISAENNSHLYQFTELYLKYLPSRSILHFDARQLSEFIRYRFEFFQETLPKVSQVVLKRPLNHDNRPGNKRILELACPDATFLIITLQAIFRRMGLKINRLFHPIIGLELDKKRQLKAIVPPTENVSRYSLTYLEFDDNGQNTIDDILLPKLKQHLDAIQMSYSAQTDILIRLDQIKAQMGQVALSPEEPAEEWEKLIDWAKDDNFSFFGYISCRHDRKKDIAWDAKGGLGLCDPQFLAKNPAFFEAIQAQSLRLKDHEYPFVFDTIKHESPIQRFEQLMRLSLKIPAANGVVTEHVFLGLLKRSSLLVKNIQTPLIHLKMKYIFETKHMLPGSFDYNEVIRIFMAIPKFELFRTAKEDLLHMVEDLLSITNPSDVYCFSRRKLNNNFRLPLMVVMPPELFNAANIALVRDYLVRHVPHSEYDMLEIHSDEYCRLHFYFDQPQHPDWQADSEKIERDVQELIKPWEARFRDALDEEFSLSESEHYYNRYAQAFPNHYRVRRTPKEAVRDLNFLEKMVREGQVQFNLIRFNYSPSVMSEKVSLASIYYNDKIDLINIMPILQNMGFYVYDELTTRIGTADVLYGYIHSFRVVDQSGKAVNEGHFNALLRDLFQAVFHGLTENDQLNALALKAELNWRQINVLQTYRNFYRQLLAPYSRRKINETLLKYPECSKLLFRYFDTKFSLSPAYGAISHRREVLLPKIEKEFIECLREVDVVSEDIVLRQLFNLMSVTLRTNFYIPKDIRDTFISVKIASREAKQMPTPAPYREIYIYDVGMEGTHLRFGSVARGGLRWSNRPEDFRREILGLVKTQQTKNVVIVPVGSKGGFIVKMLPTDKKEAAAESEKQYRKFISGLLDITDTIGDSGQVAHPDHVMIYDDDDPYLVVAADKGTANFSDLANEISEKYGFWLGDAFASGGTYGYNHKAVGITAKGAWECVTLHFRELGIDIKTQPFTVTGVGDMSGDVFGNGMMLSKTIKLRAAFNHMHIFLDPDPDTEKSYRERKRLFEMSGGSTWEDYSAAAISKGGGIFARKAKEIRLTPEIKAMLETDVDVMNGEELIQALLKMKTDLLWFAGIGTYIKAPNESSLDVGDPANDAVRIDSSQCQARVIGEGANLGVTQKGRIELNKAGHRLNTDAIDNSAGVNMSDYEVNIKILLQHLLRENVVPSVKERNKLLEKATDEVTNLVLANNRGQHRLLSMDSLRSVHHFPTFGKLIRHFVGKGLLNPQSENIPDISELENLVLNHQPIPRPVLAVLQAYAKMSVFEGIMASDILEEPALMELYKGYFPKTMRVPFESHLASHRLRREITATLLTNKIVNQAGMTFYFYAEQATGRSIGDITKTYWILDTSLKGDEFRRRVFESAVSETDKYAALIAFETLLHTLVVELLQMPGQNIRFDMIKAFTPIFDVLKKEAQHLTETLVDETLHWTQKGFDADTARYLVSFALLGQGTDVIYLTQQEKIQTETALRLAIDIDRLFRFEWLKHQLQAIPTSSEWETSQKEILVQTIRIEKLTLIRLILSHFKSIRLETLDQDTMLNSLKERFPVHLSVYLDTIHQLLAGAPVNLTSLTVAVNRLNIMLR